MSVNEERKIEKIARLIIKSLGGAISPDEKCELDAWLEESPDNVSLFGKLSDPTVQAREKERSEVFDSHSAWLELSEELKKRSEAGSRHTVLTRRRKYSVAVAAAAILICAVSLFMVNRYAGPVEISAENIHIPPGTTQAVLELDNGEVIYLSAETEVPQKKLEDMGIRSSSEELIYTPSSTPARSAWHTLKVPRGAEYKIVLSDGTQVWLNSETVLRYPLAFEGNERRVSIEGEAYFNVTHNPTIPFIVRAGDVNVHVKGTSFNVMAYPADYEVETTLVSGKVNVVSKTEEVPLMPGWQATYNAFENKMDTRSVDTRIYTAWKDGIFEFNDMQLGEICKVLGRWYNIEFVFEDNVDKMTFHGATIKKKPLEFILNLISDTNSIRYSLRDGKVVLRKKRT